MPDPASDQPTLRDVARALEAWAPPAAAQSYDNVGLQVGDARRRVHRAVVALDLTPAVVDEAQARGADLIVTHHPLLFRPLKRLTADGWVSGLALRLAEAGIALYAAHTNLDAAHGGVSFALAEQLGLQDVRFLDHAGEAVARIVLYLPAGEERQAEHLLAGHGATRLHTTAPGDGGARVEADISRWDAGRLRRALPEAWELDAYPLDRPHPRFGLGAVGDLPEAEPLSAFLARVAERLDAPAPRYVGDLDARVRRVAVCGGSGSDFIGQALAAGADAYVTADVTYHRYFDVLDADGRARMALVDAGHYETEAVTEALLVQWLTERFPVVAWHRTTTHTGPMRTYLPG